MIIDIQGDITTAEKGIILQGCNMRGHMGAGVGKAIRERWPVVYNAYRRMCDEMNEKDELRLGQVQYVRVSGNLIVANGITQKIWGRRNQAYAEITAIRECLETVCSYLITNNINDPTLHLPEIGGGTGGLNFKLSIKPVILQISQKYPNITINIWHYDEASDKSSPDGGQEGLF